VVIRTKHKGQGQNKKEKEELIMEGFVKNISSEWAYAMKRSIRPGGEIPLEELYEQYGKKYDMQPDEDFVKWLQEIKLKDALKWDIVFDFKDVNSKAVKSKAAIVPTQPVSNSVDETFTSSVAIKQLQVEDLVNLTVRKAREILPRVMDLNLLKYSLNEARQLADKDSLCRLLQKRVKELQISR